MRMTYAGPVALLALGVLASPARADVLTNWQFDPDGAAGAATRTSIGEYWDVGNSLSLISTTAPSSGSFSFTERGVAQITGHDGTPGFTGFNGQITAVFSLTGSGVLGGQINYAPGGTIQFYSATAAQIAAAGGGYGSTAGTYGADIGTNFMTLTTTGGNGLVFLSGAPNGLQTVNERVTSLLPNWIFTSGGQDAASLMSAGLLLALTTVNASAVSNPNATILSELSPLFGGGFTYTGCLPGQTTNNCTGAGAFVISNNGQQRLEVAPIPEPSTWALMAAGLGLLGFMMKRRARS